MKGIAEYVNPSGGVAARATSEIVTQAVSEGVMRGRRLRDSDDRHDIEEIVMKKVLAFLAAAMMLLAACGREGTGGRRLTLTTSDPSAPTASSDAAASDAPDATARPRRHPAAAPRRRHRLVRGNGRARNVVARRTGRGPGEPAGRRQLRQYAYSGEASDPFNPTGPPDEVQRHADQRVLAQRHDLHRRDHEQRTAGPDDDQDALVVHEGRDALASRRSRPPATSGARSTPRCDHEVPDQAGDLPDSSSSRASGNACNGSLDITIVKKTTAADATRQVVVGVGGQGAGRRSSPAS